MTHEEFNEKLRVRTKDLAIRVLRLVALLPPTQAMRTVSYQWSKSATSVGANFRAFCRGRSQNEKYAKICIVVGEADETVYWLKILQDGGFYVSDELNYLLKA